jgi:hypothetical protein
MAGCGPSDTAAYTPSTSQARQALEATLTAWRDGKPAESLDSLSPAVHPVVDRWKTGKGLESFEILKEEESQEAGKKFLVRLGMKKPDSPKEERFIVLGNNPIWVYGEEDYAHVSSMDDDPATKTRRPAAGSSRGSRRMARD